MFKISGGRHHRNWGRVIRTWVLCGEVRQDVFSIARGNWTTGGGEGADSRQRFSAFKEFAAKEAKRLRGS